MAIFDPNGGLVEALIQIGGTRRNYEVVPPVPETQPSLSPLNHSTNSISIPYEHIPPKPVLNNGYEFLSDSVPLNSLFTVTHPLFSQSGRTSSNTRHSLVSSSQNGISYEVAPRPLELNLDSYTVTQDSNHDSSYTPGQFSNSTSSHLINSGLDPKQFAAHRLAHRLAMDIHLNRDFNKDYQQLTEELEKDSENLEKLDALRQLAKDFVETAMTSAMIIINELFEDTKTIEPVPIGGIAGGIKYVYRNILFKICLDTELEDNRGWMHGGAGPSHEKAMKTGAHELRGLMHYSSLRVSGLYFPLMIVMDYKGYRLVAEALLPINKETIRYGSSDGGENVHATGEDLCQKMKAIGQELRLAPHLVRDKMIYGPGDQEVHLGLDNRYYCIDLARVFPCEPARHHLTPEVTVSTSKRPFGKVPIFNQNKMSLAPEVKDEPRSIFYKFFRPEFVLTYKKPLACDGFSGWSKADPNFTQNNRDLVEAYNYLRSFVIPSYCTHIEKILQSLRSEADPKRAWMKMGMIETLHEFGINIRHLGHVRHNCVTEFGRLLFMNEIMARTVKNLIRRKLREQMSIQKRLSDEQAKEIILTFYNYILDKGPSPYALNTSRNSMNNSDILSISNEFYQQQKECKLFPDQTFLDQLFFQFHDPLFDFELQGNISEVVRKQLYIPLLIYRLNTMLGIELHQDAFDELCQSSSLAPNRHESVHTYEFVHCDILSLRPIVRFLNLVDEAEGLALFITAKKKRAEQRHRLIKLATSKFESSCNSLPQNFTGYYYWGRGLYELAKLNPLTTPNAVETRNKIFELALEKLSRVTKLRRGYTKAWIFQVKIWFKLFNSDAYLQMISDIQESETGALLDSSVNNHGVGSLDRFSECITHLMRYDFRWIETMVKHSKTLLWKAIKSPFINNMNNSNSNTMNNPNSNNMNNSSGNSISSSSSPIVITPTSNNSSSDSIPNIQIKLSSSTPPTSSTTPSNSTSGDPPLSSSPAPFPLLTPMNTSKLSFSPALPSPVTAPVNDSSSSSTFQSKLTDPTGVLRLIHTICSAVQTICRPMIEAMGVVPLPPDAVQIRLPRLYAESLILCARSLQLRSVVAAQKHAASAPTFQYKNYGAMISHDELRAKRLTFQIADQLSIALKAKLPPEDASYFDNIILESIPEMIPLFNRSKSLKAAFTERCRTISTLVLSSITTNSGFRSINISTSNSSNNNNISSNFEPFIEYALPHVGYYLKSIDASGTKNFPLQYLAQLMVQSAESLTYLNLADITSISKLWLITSCGYLKNLQILNISGLRMQNEAFYHIADSLGHSLHTLIASFNGLTNEGLERISRKLKIIRTLDLTHNTYVGNKDLIKPTNYFRDACIRLALTLKSLILHDCYSIDSESVNEIAIYMTGLTTLAIGGKKVTDSSLSKLALLAPNLTFCSFKGMSNPDEAFVPVLNSLGTNLVNMSLRACMGITDLSLSTLIHCVNLRTLHIGLCTLVKGTCFPLMATHLKQISDLDVSNLCVDADSLIQFIGAQTTHLQILNLAGTTGLPPVNGNRNTNPDSEFIGDLHFSKFICLCTSLQDLNVSGNTKITYKTIELLARHAPNLQTLNLSDCHKMDSRIVPLLLRIKRLTTLNVKYAHESKLHFSQINQLSHIENFLTCRCAEIE